MYKKSLSWFTLIEVIVGVTLIWIIAFAGSRIDFFTINTKQLIDIELVKIENILSEVRNNALVWKAVSNTAIVPTHWTIDISGTGGSITTNYLSWATSTNYQNGNWSAIPNTSIIDLRCEDFNWSNTSSSANIQLWFTGSQIGINSGCPSSPINYKIVTLVYGQASFTGSISINTVTWVINAN